MNTLDNETIELFSTNAANMARGDAQHLKTQVLPKGVNQIKDILYKDGKDASPETGNLLDIYKPEKTGESLLPVIVDFHGGGLYYGSKENNLCRDMILASQGFAVVNANYRLVPQVSFPQQLSDAISVLSWIRNHGAEYGLDAQRVCMTGDSAGQSLPYTHAPPTALQNSLPGLVCSRQDSQCMPLQALQECIA